MDEYILHDIYARSVVACAVDNAEYVVRSACLAGYARNQTGPDITYFVRGGGVGPSVVIILAERFDIIISIL